MINIPKIEGTTMDQEGNVIPDVLIIVKNEEKFTDRSDSDGDFSLKVPEGDYVIKAVHSNYDTARNSVGVPPDSSLDVILMRE